MATQGRKNVHGKGGVRFKAPYTTAKEKAMLRNVVSELFVYEHVTVTLSTAAKVVKLADRLVTLAKANTLHTRRQAASVLRPLVVDKEKGTLVLDKLFTEIGPKFAARKGGYTRVLKLANRRGDNAPMALVSLVD